MTGRRAPCAVRRAPGARQTIERCDSRRRLTNGFRPPLYRRFRRCSALNGDITSAKNLLKRSRRTPGRPHS
ncbi:hypothetical protein BSLA_01f4218 [Burkholderia stabilis]|nr:hypothetical protein BSLA_01f4218 [Burkholderia stabilis]